MTFLRLFPLRIVLFPGMPISLEVFEPRYLTLVQECVERHEPFGVALIERGSEVGGPATPHLVGCTARIERIDPLPAGRLALDARGGRRFRITRLDRDHPYLAADVEYPVDEATEPSPALLERTVSNYRQLIRLRHTIEGSWVREVPVPSAPGALADAIGAAGLEALDAARLQTLLETLDIHRRLERAADLLTALLEATHQRATQAVVERWGTMERNN